MKDFPFRNPSLQLNARIDDIVSRLELSEKISLLLHNSPAIERLGIGPFSWWNEALHGVARAGLATVFPQAIGMAATFDRKILRKVADAVSDEARAKYEYFLAKKMTGRYCGITFWTPNINIFRDPRWGRGQETYGEDPYLTGELGVEYVKGLQGDNPKYLKTSACAKHFAVHSGPEKIRHSFDARVSAFDLEDTYLPAFRKLVQEAKVESVMGAYNRTNGEPCCGSEFLLKKTLREKWGFAGHVVSDCWAIQDFHLYHKVTAGPVESAALSLKMGCDLNCGEIYQYLQEAVCMGLVTEADVDTSLTRLLSTRFRLGEFDPKELVPWRSIPASVVHSAGHIELAYETAVASMVLLKNNGVLPLKRKELKSLYIAGPNAMSVEALIGNYHGLSPRMVTFVEGLTEWAGLEVRTEFRHGCLLNQEKAIPADWAAYEAKEYDITIVCVGYNILLEGEEGDTIASPDFGDRTGLGLPACQHEFLMKMLTVDKPVILVVSAGCAVDLLPYYERAAAIVYSWYPGEQGGRALADLLSGARDFSGKLPVTFPRSIEDLPPFSEYSMAGRTYRYLENKPAFPFGFGLSYRPLTVEKVRAEVSVIGEGQSLDLMVDIYNSHAKSATDVVQIYIHKEITGVRSARFELAGFERSTVPAGGRVSIMITVRAEQLALVHEDGIRKFRAGELHVFAGTGQPDERSRELASGQVASLVLRMD